MADASLTSAPTFDAAARRDRQPVTARRAAAALWHVVAAFLLVAQLVACGGAADDPASSSSPASPGGRAKILAAGKLDAGGSTVAQYVRLEATSEVNGNPWASMAEFNLIDGSGATLSRAGWQASADSEERVGENAPAGNAIDGDPYTLWHTQWQGSSPAMPHSFTVNLGAQRSIGGFRYLPRQIGANGRIAGWRFYTSTNGSSWLLVSQGTFDTSGIAEQTGRVDAGSTANQPPTLAPLAPTREDAIGAAVNLAVVASDPNSDALTYSATGLPSGLSINRSTGAVSGVPVATGTYYATVAVDDGRGGSASQVFNWIIDTVPVPSGALGNNPPIVLNASTSAAPGDVVSLQGENFGTSPRVYLESAPAGALEIVNRVGTGWLAVQIPATASRSLVLRVSNATGTSAPVKLNAARPYHLDTRQLNPGGAFRLFGRNLLAAGSTPTLTVNGLPATIDLAASNEHMLTATTPLALQPSAAARIVVDNGNGSGAAELDRPTAVVASGSGDPFALGVGWGAGFSAFANRTIYPAQDNRITDKAACNGVHDDSAAVQQAIDLAAASGGGVVQLPAGRCRLGSSITLRSKVVLRGAGKANTELVHVAADYSVQGTGIDLAGLSDLTMTHAVPDGDSMVLKNNTRLFMKNLRIVLGSSRQMFLNDNTDFVVAGTDVEQSGSALQQGPYTFTNASGLVFQNNSTVWVTGAPSFGRIHDSYVQTNRFTRNAADQNVGSVVHSLTLDFAYRVSVVGNSFEVAGGPITNKARNDGEAILTEGGGSRRTENIGSVASATRTTLTDASNRLMVDPFGTGAIPENYGVAIVAGKGAGQMRRLLSYGAQTATATVEPAWDIIPDATSRYASFVFGLEKALIKGNSFTQNPRGIWLYATAMRHIDVVDNTISEGGGIYLRSYQNIASRLFTPIYGVRVSGNKISNASGQWMSYINAVMVNGDGSDFGTGMIGIEIRNNEITANRPNGVSALEEYANHEGMMARMPLETSGYYQSTSIPRLLGTIFSGNSCSFCDTAVRIGSGASGTTILNTRLPASGNLYTDTSTVPSGETATATVAR